MNFPAKWRAAFVEGYREIADCNEALIEYYMVQIYCYFYTLSLENSEYRQYVKDFISQVTG